MNDAWFTDVDRVLASARRRGLVFTRDEVLALAWDCDRMNFSDALDPLAFRPKRWCKRCRAPWIGRTVTGARKCFCYPGG